MKALVSQTEAQKGNDTAQPVTRHIGTAALRILSPRKFEIEDSPLGESTLYSPYHVPDTSDLASIEAILADPGWDEDMITAAVAALVEADEKANREPNALEQLLPSQLV